jgi:hypothetical protein
MEATMANANTPFGLKPVKHRNGAHYNGAARTYYVPASYGTALFIGDPVIAVTDSADANGVHTVARATAAGGAYILGVVVGIGKGPYGENVQLQSDPIYHVASTAGYVMVADDPDLLFEIQEDAVGGAMVAGAAGRNVDLIAGTGSTTTGKSGFLADSSTLNTTNTLQLRIVEPVIRPDNEIAAAYAKWLVAINLHSLRNLTGV